jgi:hypothetical protein
MLDRPKFPAAIPRKDHVSYDERLLKQPNDGTTVVAPVHDASRQLRGFRPKDRVVGRFPGRHGVKASQQGGVGHRGQA